MPEDKVTTLRAAAAQRKDLLFFDPKLLAVAEGHNPRDYKLRQNREHLDELKESIKANGVLQPLWVRIDKESGVILIVDGECRWRAVNELIEEGLEIKTVPAVEKTGTEQELLILALTANTGKSLSQWEVGGAYKRFIAWGWTPEQIAEKMGQTVAYVNTAIDLAGADKVTRQLLSEGAVTPSCARSVIKKHGDKTSLVLAELVKKAAKENEEKAAKKKAAKGGKEPKKTAKPAKATREKAVTSAHVKFADIKKVITILEWVQSNQGEDVDTGLSAENMKAKLSKLLPEE